MKKFKKKYKLGGYTTEQLFSTTDDGVTVDQNFGKDLGTAGAIYGTQTKVNNAVTGMALNSLGEGDDKDFAAQEAARMQKFQPLGVLGAGISMFGAGKRRKAFDNNLAQEDLMDRNQTMIANDYSGYAQDARVTFAGGGNMGTNADEGLVEIEGPSHEENPYGGTPVGPEALLEGGETKKGNYVWSKRVLVPGKKTNFAEESKLIHKMYRKKRPNDPISIKAEERELGKLEQAQEVVRNTIMDKAYKKAYGGFLKKKYSDGGKLKKGELPLKQDDFTKGPEKVDTTGLSKNPYLPMLDPNWIYDDNSELQKREPSMKNIDMQNQVLLYRKYLEQSKLPIQHPKLKKKMAFGGYDDEIDYTVNPKTGIPFSAPESLQQGFNPNMNVTDGILDLPGFVAPTSNNNNQYPALNFNQADAAKYNINPVDNNINITENSGNVENLNSAFGMQPEDYASIGVQALSGLSQLYYGLKGPDKVRDAKFNLIRPNKVNLAAAKRLASQEIDNAFNGVDYDVRGNATSTGNYLGNRLASGIKRAKSKGELLGRLGMEEANANAQIMNSVGSANAQILNQEEQMNLGQEDKRIQEKDASRMAVTEGLNNVGQSFGQGVKDKRAYDMQKLKSKWLGTKDIETDEYGNKYYILSNGQRKYVEE